MLACKKQHHYANDLTPWNQVFQKTILILSQRGNHFFNLLKHSKKHKSLIMKTTKGVNEPLYRFNTLMDFDFLCAIIKALFKDAIICCHVDHIDIPFSLRSLLFLHILVKICSSVNLQNFRENIKLSFRSTDAQPKPPPLKLYYNC